MTAQNQVIIFNSHRNEFEVWCKSEVIGHGTDLDALLKKFPNAAFREK